MMRGMAFLVRPATGADSAAAAEVVHAVFVEYGFTWEPDGYCADLYDLGSHYLHEHGAFWVAELTKPHGSFPTGAIVGTCGLEIFPALPDAESGLIEIGGKVRAAGADCSLERLYVRPEIRRMGLGRALLATSVTEAKRAGCRRMEIWSDVLLTLAHAMYERYGAERLGQRRLDDPDNSLEWGMRLDLELAKF